MTIEMIKEKMENNLGKTIKIKYNGSRNKIEHYEAVIEEIYNYIFTVKLINNFETKSFSYSDILTKTVEIYF